MRRFLTFIAAATLISCTQTLVGDDPPNTSVEIFDQFWKGVDMNWPEFATKHVNWDSLYQVYRPQVNAATNDAQVLAILKALLYNLKDRHTDVFPKNGSVFTSYQPSYPPNFYGINWIRDHYIGNIKFNNSIAYGFIAQDIGYIYIATFENGSDDYAVIDGILDYFKNVKGIIVDVRNNGGGYVKNSQLIASRFADEPHIYDYLRYRSGRGRTDMGELLAEQIVPGGPRQFSGKVAVLTNRGSFSATENFILMMRTFHNVTLIGDNTLGGSGTAPIFKELPRGWYFRVSSALLMDLSQQPISKGIAPDILMKTTRADSLIGKDTIIERAKLEVVK